VVGRGPALVAHLLALVAGVPHPSHTSSAELVARQDSVLVTIRMFADDLAGTGDLKIYVGERFGIADRRGTPVRLEWFGSEPVGDVLVVRLKGLVPGGLPGARVRHELLTERFTDQVNLVRVRYADRVATLIFVRGDRPKTLP
jgi:hypothetical protein